MAFPDTATPAPAATGHRRQNGRARRLDVPPDTISTTATQQDRAARVVAAKYGLTMPVAALIAGLAGLGGRP
jgi:hypothetical protein